jgi:tetratricopeptide (TPR) repeat protein
MSRLATLLIIVSGALAGIAHGQALVLKDGTRIPEAAFKVEDGKIVRTVKIGEKEATTVLPKTNIASMDWPMPVELADAKALMSQGKAEEAVATLKKGRDFFEHFQDIKGNWYGEMFFAYVEALNQAGQFEETVKMIPQVKLLPLSDEQKMKLRVIQLDIDRQTSSEYISILAEADSILSETNDSSVAAAIWSIIADIHAKKKEWEKALMAYLRIPVFYGTQVQRVPDAEMKAAQMLVKMKRYEDAHATFTRLAETYAGSAIAEAANKEKAAINGMKNEPEEQPAAEAPKEGEAAAKTDSKS